MDSSTSSMTPSRGSGFDGRVEEVKLDKSLINELVMDYLIRENCPQAATNFAREANLEPRWDAETIEERLNIQNCIYAGNIQEAIEKINDLDPELLDKNKSLHFALLRLQLIELIRPAIENPDRDMVAALEFAEENLAPRAPASLDHLRDLEETMTLLIFSPGKIHSSMTHLLEPELKKSVAKRVNDAILESVGNDRRNRLYELVKLREWAEIKARNAKRDIPERIDIGLRPTRLDDEDSIMHIDGNGRSENIVLS